MSRVAPRRPMSARPPLNVGAAVKNGQWAVARFEGEGRRMLRYLAMGRAGRRAELKEYFPPGWHRQDALCEPSADADKERELAAYVRRGHDLAAELPSHPNLLKTLEVFEDAGTFFTVQEWIEGESLERRVLRSGPMPVREAIEAVRQAGEGLAALHGQSLLHRDVSPDNILLTDGRVLLMDFELLSPFPEVRKFGGRVLVNPVYAPLELLSVYTSYGPESDVYGLAASLYFALAGKPATPSAQRVAAPRLPASSKISPEIFTVLERAMTVRAKERTSSVAEFLAGLPPST